MKEIIKHIDGVAGRVITITGLTETTMTRENVLGILNGTQNEVLYVPMFYGDLQRVTYSNGTLTITLADTVTAIANGDKLFVKLYTDVDLATAANQQIIIQAVKNNDTTVLAELLNQTYGLSAIATAIAALVIPTVADIHAGLAKQGDDTTATNTAILSAFATLQTAVQGNDSTATLTALKSLISAIPTTSPATPNDVTTAKEAIMGGGSGTGKSVKDVYDAMPTIPTDYAKQGTNGSATLSETQAQATAAANASSDAAGKAGDLKTWINIPSTGHTVSGDAETAATKATSADTKIGAKDSSDSEEPSTLFGWFERQWQKVVSIYNALTDNTNGLGAIKTAVGNIPTTTPSTESQVNAARDKVMGGTGYGGTGKSVKDISDVLGTPASGHTVAGDAGNAATDAAAIKTAIGDKSNSAGEASTDTMFSWVKKLRDYLNGIVNTAPYAKESSVKTNVGGTDYTAIGELRDNNHGLSALLAKLAQIIAYLGTIQTETEILSLPNAARIDIVTPEQSSGAISNLQIHANVMYHLGDLTALSLIMVEPSDLTIYNEFVVCFFCQTGFTLQITHWDANTQVLFNSGATCEAGHYYILSVVDNLALLAKF